MKSVSPYDVKTDIELIDTIIETCTPSWMRAGPQEHTDTAQASHPLPIFVVGLPRTGTTLTERILSSHSLVGSVGETFFLPQALRAISNVRSTENLTSEIIRTAAAAAPGELSSRYIDAVQYKLGNEPRFVEKLPENFLLLGFIARSFANPAVIHLDRHPMDACFAMFKQSYFRYAYSLEDVGRYYVAYDRLMTHWRSVLGARLIEVRYEDLVANPEEQVRQLLDRLGLPFEDACLNFQTSRASSRTASAVQVRERIHTRSVSRWRHFERQLEPLQKYLVAKGIAAQ